MMLQTVSWTVVGSELMHMLRLGHKISLPNCLCCKAMFWLHVQHQYNLRGTYTYQSTPNGQCWGFEDITYA